MHLTLVNGYSCPGNNCQIMCATDGRKEGNVLFNDALNTFYCTVIWRRTYGKEPLREETCCRHMGYSFRLTARVLLYAPSHRQDSTYHSLCYTSRGARNSSMGQQMDAEMSR